MLCVYLQKDINIILSWVLNGYMAKKEILFLICAQKLELSIRNIKVSIMWIWIGYHIHSYILFYFKLNLVILYILEHQMALN